MAHSRHPLLFLATALMATCLPKLAPAQDLGLVRVAEGFSRPTGLCSPPGDASRLFVLEEKRGISILADGLLLPNRFLDLTGVASTALDGLTGMAFHPDFAQNGRFYVVYQDTNNDSLLVEYEVSSDPNVADPASAKVLLGPVPQLDVLHNWNQAHFGQDGMLYLATGDGGPGHDPNDRGQDLGLTFGKILRLDVDLPAPHVPPDNPFVGIPGAEELIWAYGLRQPWRISFDSMTGDLWIADVGQNTREEIDVLPISSTGGENFGWRCMEGLACTGIGACGCADPGWAAPVLDFEHTEGRCCVIGGTVYRGSAIPSLVGKYLYADFCSARVWSMRYDGAAITNHVEHIVQPCAGASLDLVYSWGEDADGELYLLDGTGGEVFKVVPANSTAYPYCAVTPNSVGPGARLNHNGTTSTANDDLLLKAFRAVPGQPAVFFYGRNRLQVPFGDGFRCAAGQVRRLKPTVSISPQGTAEHALDLSNPTLGAPPIQAGDAFAFQFWYRDPVGPGGTGFNLSNGLWVEFCP